jgi:uncharacterized protein
MTKTGRFITMRSITLLICLLAAFFCVRAQDPAWSQNVSPLERPKGPIGDYADVIDPTTEATLDKKLRDFFDRTGVPIAVATVKTTGERDIFDYTVAVSRGWGIGTKADDNPGLLMLVAVDDRKYFTQVSKDLEDELPDGVVGSLQRQFLVPEFRKQNYGKGISDTVDAYIGRIEQKTSGFAPPAPQAGTQQDESGSPSLFSIFCCLAVILFIILLVWSNRNSGGKSKGDNDRWGGGGGGIADVLPWIILSGGSGGGSSSSSGWGGSSDWGSSGGSSDWGGFGGGGDFGGGGAGGDW